MTTAPEAPPGNLPVQTFATAEHLEGWLREHHESSPGIWVRLYRSGSTQRTVTFIQLVEATLAYGWSESRRRRYDNESYVQLITPRKAKGTTSRRNRDIAAQLIAQGRMTPAGLAALGIQADPGWVNTTT